MRSAGAWIRHSSSRQELTCGLVKSSLSAVAAQSNGSGPSGRARIRGSRGHGGAGSSRNRRVYAAGVPCGIQVSGRRAYRVAAERRLLKFQRVEECRQIRGELLDRVRAGPVAGTVPAQVGCIHAPRGRECLRDRRPVRGLLAERMQQYQRRCPGRSPGPVREPCRPGLNTPHRPRLSVSHAADAMPVPACVASPSARSSGHPLHEPKMEGRFADDIRDDKYAIRMTPSPVRCK